MNNCLFCKIAEKEIPSETVFEDNGFVVFKDINPKAPLHLLVVPRKHVESVDHATPEDTELLGRLLLTAQKVAAKEGVAGGYKLQINVGRQGGQVIDHVHVHLLAEKKI